MKVVYIFLLYVSSIFAHPHTFIEVYPSIEVENDKMQTIHFKWVLDEMTSTILIMEMDRDMNGVIDKKENFFIYANYFTLFKDYSYYTHIKVDGKAIEFPKPKNFRATIENNRICYSFDIEQNYNIKNTVLEFGDTDFYVAMVLKKEFVTLKGASAKVSGVDTEQYYGYSLELK
ncbi:MAG: DUF1007 family protein [Campylobacterota bacterium]|nr:DUF1007 family protein [Campylobacterota bacterium]